MKQLFAALTIICFLGVGCVQIGGPVGENNILKTTNAIYLDVRTVVTDPEVMPMFSPDELEQLAELERQYLEIAEILKDYPNDEEAIQQISWLATKILGIIGQVDFVEEARPYIAAIRISIQLLRNHL